MPLRLQTVTEDPQTLQTGVLEEERPETPGRDLGELLLAREDLSGVMMMLSLAMAREKVRRKIPCLSPELSLELSDCGGCEVGTEETGLSPEEPHGLQQDTQDFLRRPLSVLSASLGIDSFCCPTKSIVGGG